MTRGHANDETMLKMTSPFWMATARRAEKSRHHGPARPGTRSAAAGPRAQEVAVQRVRHPAGRDGLSPAAYSACAATCPPNRVCASSAARKTGTCSPRCTPGQQFKDRAGGHPRSVPPCLLCSLTYSEASFRKSQLVIFSGTSLSHACLPSCTARRCRSTSWPRTLRPSSSGFGPPSTRHLAHDLDLAGSSAPRNSRTPPASTRTATLGSRSRSVHRWLSPVRSATGRPGARRTRAACRAAPARSWSRPGRSARPAGRRPVPFVHRDPSPAPLLANCHARSSQEVGRDGEG